MSNGRLQLLKLSQQRFRCWYVRDENYGRSNGMCTPEPTTSSTQFKGEFRK